MVDLSHIPSKRQAEQENRFTLWGHTFSADPYMIPYNSIHKQFRGLAHETEANFESRVVNRCKSQSLGRRRFRIDRSCKRH